MYILNSCVV